MSSALRLADQIDRFAAEHTGDLGGDDPCPDALMLAEAATMLRDIDDVARRVREAIETVSK